MTDYSKRYDDFPLSQKLIGINILFTDIDKDIFRLEILRNHLLKTKIDLEESKTGKQYKEEQPDEYNMALADCEACFGAIELMEKRLEDMQQLLINDKVNAEIEENKKHYVSQMEYLDELHK